MALLVGSGKYEETNKLRRGEKGHFSTRGRTREEREKIFFFRLFQLRVFCRWVDGDLPGWRSTGQSGRSSSAEAKERIPGCGPEGIPSSPIFTSVKEVHSLYFSHHASHWETLLGSAPVL